MFFNLKNKYMFWKILIIVVTIFIALDVIGTIHNAIMIRENKKLVKKNKKRSKDNSNLLKNL